MPTFGEVIREKGISQRQLANDLGISVTSIPLWKYQSVPRPTIRDRIERYFGVEGILFGQDVRKKVEAKENSRRFADLMTEQGVSIAQMSQDTGFSRSSISGWRRHESPPNHKRKLIEEYLRVTGVIFGGDDVKERGEKTPERVAERSNGNRLEIKKKDYPEETVALTASEEYALRQVIKVIGFAEALRRLVR